MERKVFAVVLICVLLGATSPAHAQDKQPYFELDFSRTILSSELDVVNITTFNPAATQSRSMEITWSPKDSPDTIFITVVAISQCKFKSNPSDRLVRFRVLTREPTVVNPVIADEAPNKYLGNRNNVVLVTLTLPAETISEIVKNDI